MEGQSAELKINTLEIMMAQNAKEHEDIKKSMDNGFERVELSIKELSSNFAGKWTEKVLIGLGVLIGTGLFGWIVNTLYEASQNK